MTEDSNDDNSVTTTFGVNRPTISCFFDSKHNFVLISLLRSQRLFETKNSFLSALRWRSLSPALLPVPG